MKYNSYWRRKRDSQIFILVEADGMLDVVLLKGIKEQFSITFQVLAEEFENVRY